jgi:hypothetical protein
MASILTSYIQLRLQDELQERQEHCQSLEVHHRIEVIT